MSVHSQYSVIRQYLIQNSYWMALEALDYAERFHTGERRNGDHELSHPIQVALQLIESGVYMERPEETIAAALLHDIPEDYDIGFDVIESKFGPMVKDALVAVTKVHRGFSFSFSAKMSEAAHNPIASLVKPSDRLHNLKTLHGAFTRDGGLQYIEETNGEIIPAMKLSMKLHPTQSSSVSFFLSEITLAARRYLSTSNLTAAE